MSTKIEWTDETWNPVTGCTKVSQGCKNCYAERIWPKVAGAEAARAANVEAPGHRPAPRAFTDVRCHSERLDAPLHWKKPRRVFVNSMSDLFHEDVPEDFILNVFNVMRMAWQHTFQVLTKRPQRMLDLCGKLSSSNAPGCGPLLSFSGRHPIQPLPNVWLGVSVEDQATADERIPLLMQTPAAVRFLSCEPLLGALTLCPPADSTYKQLWPFYYTGKFDEAAAKTAPPAPDRIRGLFPKIDWIIAGGESGPKARPSHPDWFRSLRDQCAAAGVPFFFKQYGEWAQCDTDVHADEYGTHVYPLEESILEAVYDLGDPRRIEVMEAHGIEFGRFGKKLNGRTLDGREHNEYPA